MFERNIIKQLRIWAGGLNRKPLVLRGARQVGKTTLINEFSKDFDTYLYLNLEISQAKELFETEKGIEEILSGIYLYCNKPKTNNKTLLFIDEIQNSTKAIMQLRYFYEQIPELYVIAAGSLLESLIDTHISFPVGRVEYMAIRPCTFDEFLGAMGETEIKKAVVELSVPEVIHNKISDLFNTYTLIGGMPEVVSFYSKYKDLVAINNIYESLLFGYKEDVEKYARNQTMAHAIRYILDEGWSFAAQRITIGSFAGSSYKAREMGEAFRTLEKAMLLELTYPTTNYMLPLVTNHKRKPKLFWLDTGLVNYSANIQREIFGTKDITDIWRGLIAEQIVAQELLAANTKLSNKRIFWVRDKKGADSEIDFIIQYENMLIPLEVKSGHNSKLKSLHIFMENTNHSTAIRIWNNPFSIDKVKTQSGKEFNLYNVPFYYAGNINKILKTHL
ncbi:MAG: AAA family ATPase [Bacteroidales bacterium]|jgi:predicted AAA+ superfamily ATPase|nr:AAA family ATPase [Bacteroidales bacterium]